MFFWFLMTVLGLFFVSRTLKTIVERLRVSKSWDVVLQIFIFMFVIAAAVKFHARPLVLFSLFLFLIATLWCSLAIRYHLLKRIWSGKEVTLIEFLSLKVRSGVALKEALRVWLSTQSKWIQSAVERILISQDFQKETDFHPIFGDFFVHLSKIQKTQHRQAERLKSFSQRLKIQMKIRQKSRAALMQTRAQSLVVVTIYAPTLIYCFVSGKDKVLGAWFYVSILLVTTGFVVIYLMGKSIKWKT